MNHNLRFNEDKAEMEAHFAERVQAYIELGETEEQAKRSAQQKFGETEAVLRELRWQQRRRTFRSPIVRAAFCAAGFLLASLLFKVTGFVHTAQGNLLFNLMLAVYIGLSSWTWGSRRTRCVWIDRTGR